MILSVENRAEDELVQEALFEIEGPDEDACVWQYPARVKVRLW
jgi:hypothetical protein